MDLSSITSYMYSVGSDNSLIINIAEVATIVGLWGMMVKAGEPGWVAIIPFYNMYKLCEKVMNNPWYWVRLFVAVIPLVGWIGAIYFYYQICKATAASYGKPAEWAWGYLFLSPIFFCITGFDSNIDYYGPWGEGDTRTSQARGAKTVDFEVIKNEPETVNEYETVPPQDDDVEFTFEEPEE